MLNSYAHLDHKSCDITPTRKADHRVTEAGLDKEPLELSHMEAGSEKRYSSSGKQFGHFLQS